MKVVVLEVHVQEWIVDKIDLAYVKGGGPVAEYKLTHRVLKRTRWMRLLIRKQKPTFIDETTGAQREMDLNDNNAEVPTAYHSYVNPLWKLYYSEGTDDPLEIVIRMLPSAPDR